ncbi:MAG: sodium:solute symporter family protein [Woeseiaceae bacterium]|nr:sodium:solute symporter family protein [Woeseiaceae bacterium]
MGSVDTAILFGYLGVLIALGFYANYKQRNVDDYFVAGRRMGPFTIGCLWLASWVGGASIVGSSARAYDLGVTAIWYVLALAIGCLLFGFLLAARIKRLGDAKRHLTYPDFIEEYYDSRTRIVATITTVLAFTAYSAGQLVAAGAILQVLLGWDYSHALMLASGIVILYTATGGYLAVTYTDWVQFVLLFVGIVLIGMPIAIEQAGSWTDLQAALPQSYFDPGTWGWGRIAALTGSIVLSFFVAMDSYSRSLAARDESAARNGALLAVVFMLPIAVAATWLGMAAAVLFPGTENSSGILTLFVLETFPVGLKGLVLVGVLAAVMSSADISILTASANYTRDIHQRFLQPDISEQSMLRLSILSSSVLGLVAAAMAWKMQDIIDVLQLGFTINGAALFLPTVVALFWKRHADAVAAFWSICLSLTAVLMWRFGFPDDAGGLFAVDPLWPGLVVSVVVFFVLSRRAGAGRAKAVARA